ncbi:MAG TPA: GtrA family protein [Nocardioides sp.]|uniref:GtrA family protein n=1 Tax=Nocardioides sp. TaxID=35761 RepID=UPI002ED991DE
MPRRPLELPALTEVGRFMAVGGVSTTVAFLIFNLLLHGFNPSGDAPLSGHPITAYVIANTVGMVISYELSRSWAFRHRPPRHADGGRTAYVVINVVTMSLPVCCLWFSRSVLGLESPLADNLSANVIGLAGGLVARFYLFRRFVFHRPISLVEIYDDPEEVQSPVQL